MIALMFPKVLTVIGQVYRNNALFIIIGILLRKGIASNDLPLMVVMII